MGRWLSLLLTGLFLLTGCGLSWGKLPFQQEKPRFAVVDWDRLVEQHPRYKEWQRQKEQLETAKWLRDRQKENGQQQLALLGQMKKVREAGKGQFQSAQWSAKVAEKRAQEQDLLRKKRAALEEEAESRVKADRDAVEEKYRIPLFNLRLKLGSVKMNDAAQKALLQEQQELLDKRQKDRAEVEAEKEQWLQQQLAADVAASQARLQAFSKELAGQVVQEQTGLSMTGKKPRNQEAGTGQADPVHGQTDPAAGRQGKTDAGGNRQRYPQRHQESQSQPEIHADFPESESQYQRRRHYR